jgi:replicative DNA helicase
LRLLSEYLRIDNDLMPAFPLFFPLHDEPPASVATGNCTAAHSAADPLKASPVGGLVAGQRRSGTGGDLLTHEDRHASPVDLYAAIGHLINATKPADIITVFGCKAWQGR